MTTSQGQFVYHVLMALWWTALALVFIADIFEQKEAPGPVVCQCQCDGSTPGR